jgi:hypothetical protein
MKLNRLVIILRLAALAAPLAGCFNPQQPPCAFSCGPADECPEAYVCGDDHFCHRADGVGRCLLSPDDAGADGPDASEAAD